MIWLFERTVELAAWLALILFWIALGVAIYMFVGWIRTLDNEVAPDYFLLRDAGIYAVIASVMGLVLGGLACVDRFLFDADEPRK